VFQLDARQSHPRARPRRKPVGAVRLEAKGRRDKVEGDCLADVRALLVSERKKKDEGWFGGLRLRCGLCRLVRGMGRFWPKSVAILLQSVLNLDIN
jgi:hypothetical protein